MDPEQNGSAPNEDQQRAGADGNGSLPPVGPIEGKFVVGKLVMTRGVAHEVSAECVLKVLGRHVRGDWGDLCAEDKQENERAVREGNGRILSAYGLPSAIQPDGEVRLYSSRRPTGR